MNYREALTILKDKEVNIKVDGRARRDIGFPVGVMDIVEIAKTGEAYRCMYDVKGRFVLKAVKADEGKFKLCKVT